MYVVRPLLAQVPKTDHIYHCFVPRLFSSPANSSLTSVGRKRRAIEQDDVVRVVVMSAKSPISDGKHSFVIPCYGFAALSPVN